MWMRSGCSQLLSLVVAIGCGVLGATRAEAGYAPLKPPGPSQTVSTDRPSGQDFTPRCELPELKFDHSASPRSLHVPDAADFRGHRTANGEDPLVARLQAPKSDGARYGQFWEHGPRGLDRDNLELGIDVKGSAPVVVPLPPGVWAGLATLAGVIWFQVRRHRRQLA